MNVNNNKLFYGTTSFLSLLGPSKTPQPHKKPNPRKLKQKDTINIIARTSNYDRIKEIMNERGRNWIYTKNYTSRSL